MTKTALKVVDLAISYNRRKVIDNVSISVDYNEVIGIIGENGAGKTTLLKAIMGVNRLSGGSILFEGSNIVFPDSYNSISFVSDESNFYPFWSAKLNLKYFSLSRLSDAQIVCLLTHVGLGDYMDRKVSTFSLGMKQRLNIARGLSNSPRLLLMDEPMNSLDPIGIAQFKNGIKKYLSDNNASLLISSHALKEMLFFCDKFIFLKNGRVTATIESKNNFEQYDAFITCKEYKSALDYGFNKINHYHADYLSRIYFKYSTKLVFLEYYTVT